MTPFPSRRAQLADIERQLRRHHACIRPLPGLSSNDRVSTLALQVVASIRRFDLTRTASARDISPRRLDPNDEMFEPDRAATSLHRTGNDDEAIWLTFLATHFGKHRQYAWKRLRDVYSGLGRKTWTWAVVVADPAAFVGWLSANWRKIGGAFGNHRKYETLDPASRASTGNVVLSFIAWIGPQGPAAKFRTVVRQGGNDPRAIFDAFYRDMSVKRFARLGKFDFLALIGRLKLAPIEPGVAYLKGATGPLTGARLLFGSTASEATLEKYLVELEHSLGTGQDILEDSICNWQKSPDRFIRFFG
jgi:hypothetical protein